MSEVTEERDWVDKKLDDPEFRKTFLEELHELHQGDLQAAVAAERERCKRAICEHCANDIPVRWWQGAGGFWAHHDSVGTNIGSCAAAAIRRLIATDEGEPDQQSAKPEGGDGQGGEGKPGDRI